MATDTSAGVVNPPTKNAKLATFLRMLLRDGFATAAALFLCLLLLCAILGPFFLRDLAIEMDLGKRNVPPFSLENGVAYVLGADSLGRSMLARLIVGARTTLMISGIAVVIAMTLGGTIGVFVGYVGGWTSTIVMRLTDIVISFPGLLLALIVLYIIGPSVINVILILAFGALPLYIRTARAETLEIRERMFVSAARSLGVSTPNIVFRHIMPLVVPTLTTVAAVNFASVLLSESALSFLGLGIQAPEFTWGAMVAAGRQYLQTAWWLAFWPGLLIMMTTLSLNLISNWIRTATDPHQRWRLQISHKRKP